MSWARTASFPKVGRLVAWGALLPLATAALGCQIVSVGLATDATIGDTNHVDALDSGGLGDAGLSEGLGGSAIDTDAYGDDTGGSADIAPVFGAPIAVGCSDGTREGFRDLKNWPLIAGCAGAWQVAGLLSLSARQPQCSRVAGNDSRNPQGTGCSASDLCAPTWHGCLDGPDVASHSPTGGCENILLPGEQAIFVVMTGASPLGVCYPDPSASNNLHGCGSIIGEPESSECSPLTRRMGFADCMRSVAWNCGGADESLFEADVVTKVDSSQGGILCCKD